MFKKCNNCGAIVRILKDCQCDDCGIKCCNNEMLEVKANSVDASFEKHVPEYEVKGDVINVLVNHVMEDDHYIEWIGCFGENKEEIIYLKPGEEARVTFKYVPGVTLFAYCNKHSLWSKNVE